MLFPKLLVIWIVWFRTSHSISPGVLLALANLQNQRARSIANALNWRAKAQYNVALARSRANLAKLGDRRLIRNSRGFHPDNIVAVTQENIQDHNNLGEDSNIQSSNNQNNDFHLNHRAGTLHDESGLEMENDYSRSITDPIGEYYPTTVTQTQISNIPNDESYYAEGNESDAEFYPETISPPSNILEEDLIAPELSEYKSTEEKSAEADPHKHLNGHFHKQTINHNIFLEPPTRFEHLHTHQFTRPGAFEHQYSPQFARPGGFEHIYAPHLPSPGVNVHVFQNQHIGEVSSDRPFGHLVPSPSSHLFGHTPVFRSDAGTQYSPTDVTFDEEQVYGPERDVIGSTWNDEGEDDTLGTFHLPLFDTNAPLYPNLRDPNQFNTREPQNFQAVVRFIEDEQRSIDKMIHNLDKNTLHYNGPTSLIEVDDYLDHSGEHQMVDGASDYYEVRDSAKETHDKGRKAPASKVPAENVGAINSFTMDNTNFNPMNMENVFPIPASSVPSEFNQIDAKSQQDLFSKYLETEQMNLQRAIQELQEDHQRNLDHLLHYFNAKPNNNDSPYENYMNIRTDSNDVDEHETNTNHIENAPQALKSSFNENTWLENPQQIFSEADLKRREAEENENTQILTDFLQNNPGIGDRLGYSSTENPIVGHIIQVPERRYSNNEHHQRRTRSSNIKYSVNYLDQLLKKENDTIQFLKKCAKHDEDLMMIGYIEESFINDLQNRLNKTRTKRQLDKNLPLARLFNDPKSRFDMPKTLENLWAIARNAFEHEQQPMYHVRNMVGSAKDAVVAAMKIPNQNFVFPSQYDIVDNQPNGLVGDINPKVFSNNWDSGGTSSSGESKVDPVMNTFQQVGSVIRESVLSGQQALSHVGDIANHAKSAIYDTRNTLPKIIQRKVPDFIGKPKEQMVIITPRIFDTADDTKVTQSVGETKFVRLGNVLDALGVSNPNPSLNFEKITVEPRNVFYDQEQSTNPLQYPTPNYLGNLRVEDINNIEEDKDFVGNALNNLELAKTSVGAKNIKEFILKMKNKLQTWMDDNIMQRRLGVIKSVTLPIVKKSYRKRPSKKWTGSTPSKSPLQIPSKTSSEVKDAETVGASFIPMELTHPFLNQPATNQLEQFMRVNTESGKRNRHYEEDLGPVLGAINPMMFERIFKERLQKSNKTGTPHDVFSDYRHGRQMEDPLTNDNDEVSTSMVVKGKILKPFMGQATSKNKKAFFKKYLPIKDKDSANSKFEKDNYHEYESIEYTWE